MGSWPMDRPPHTVHQAGLEHTPSTTQARVNPVVAHPASNSNTQALAEMESETNREPARAPLARQPARSLPPFTVHGAATDAMQAKAVHAMRNNI